MGYISPAEKLFCFYCEKYNVKNIDNTKLHCLLLWVEVDVLNGQTKQGTVHNKGAPDRIWNTDNKVSEFKWEK